MNFKQFKQRHQEHIATMLDGQNHLFVVDVDRDELWELYLNSFPPGTNEVYRERRAHDCSCCRHFIKRLGNVVMIDDDNEVVTIWDFDAGSDTYQPVVDALAEHISNKPVCDLFVTKDSAFGTDENHEMLDDGSVHTWQHFRVDLPTHFVTDSHKTIPDLMGEARTSKEVFQRSLEEISVDATGTILDLIAEKSLYRGEEWQGALTMFRGLQYEYQQLSDGLRNNYCWKQSTLISGAISRIRNHSIGVLLQDITANVDILEAVGRYEHIVAPTNYKRPKAIFTAKMVKDAQATVERLGLTDSLGRRFARLDDINITNVIWANKDAEKEMDGLGIFEELAREATLDPRRFEHAQGVAIETFISEMLPSAASVEVLLENRHQGNLVSLIAPQNSDAPSLFKWDNGFSWAYAGNVADSMKARVKALGGDVEGVLRFSIQWNEELDNPNDFDAHCIEPAGGSHIYFSNKGHMHASTGMLDVDIINPGRKVAVENITWARLDKMREGVYHFFVHNYSHNGGRTGFRAEIEYGGQIYEYDYPNELSQNENVTVAKVQFSRRDGIKFVESLATTTSAKEAWGMTTNQWQPVSTVTYSPNYWDDQSGIGNRHYMFFLAGCVNDDSPNGFYNEFLQEAFMEHKRVFAALGSKMCVEHAEKQLSGIGFSSTKRNSVLARVDGQRVVKIIF